MYPYFDISPSEILVLEQLRTNVILKLSVTVSLVCFGPSSPLKLLFLADNFLFAGVTVNLLLPSVGNYCNRTWDGWMCWGDSAPGTAMQMCPTYFQDFDPGGETFTERRGAGLLPGFLLLYFWLIFQYFKS